MSDLDSIFSELSEISLKLRDLPADAYDERAGLETRRNELRSLAASLRTGIGDRRPTAEVKTELRSLRDRLHQIEGSGIDVVRQHGGSGLEISEAWDSFEINRQIEKGGGADELRERIKQLEKVLAERDDA